MKGTPRDKVAHYLKQWFKEMKLDEKKRIVPLSHNYARDMVFLERWLSEEYPEIFSYNHRDIQTAALFMNDVCASRAEPVRHAKTDFSYIANNYKVEQLTKHNAASDCLTLAKVYKRMLQEGVF